MASDLALHRGLRARGPHVTGRPGVGALAPAHLQARDETVTVLYRAYYASLVRLAALMVGDVATAEDVVQESFVAMHQASWRLRDDSKALPYLRRIVVNRARSVLRHRTVAQRHTPQPAPNWPSAEENALQVLERSSLMSAMSTLSAKQRQVIVLRYYADLSEAQIADAMGISRGAVKSHASRAIDSLRAALR